MRIFDRQKFTKDRHTRQEGGQKPECIVQADPFGQETNDGRPHQHARVTRRGEGSNGQSLGHGVLRAREVGTRSARCFRLQGPPRRSRPSRSMRRVRGGGRTTPAALSPRRVSAQFGSRIAPRCHRRRNGLTSSRWRKACIPAPRAQPRRDVRRRARAHSSRAEPPQPKIRLPRKWR